MNFEVVMPAPADALPLDVDRAGEPRQAVARSGQDRWDVSEFDKCEIAKFEIDKSKVRPDPPPYDHRGTVVVASVWLALYVIMVIHHFIAAMN
jgi:hypothetical protein